MKFGGEGETPATRTPCPAAYLWGGARCPPPSGCRELPGCAAAAGHGASPVRRRLAQGVTGRRLPSPFPGTVLGEALAGAGMASGRGAGPGRSLPAGGGRPPTGGCAPPRRRTASRRRPPPARPAATGGCHSSGLRGPPGAAEGKRPSGSRRGGRGRSAAPRRKTLPAPQRGARAPLASPAFTAAPPARPLPSAPPGLPHQSFTPKPPGCGRVSMETTPPLPAAPHGTRRRRAGAGAAFSPAGWLRGRVPKPCRVAGTGSPTAGREKRQAEPRDGDTAPSPPPAEVSCLPWGERGESPGAPSPSRVGLAAPLCHQTHRSGGFVGRSVPPRRAEGPRPRGRSHRRGQPRGVGGGGSAAVPVPVPVARRGGWRRGTARAPGCGAGCRRPFPRVKAGRKPWERGVIHPNVRGFYLRSNYTFMIQLFFFFPLTLLWVFFAFVCLFVFAARPPLVSSQGRRS